MELIDCKTIRNLMLNEAKKAVDQIFAQKGEKLKITIIQVLGDGASNVYIRNKLKTANEVNIVCKHIILPNTVEYDQLKNAILNEVMDEDCTAVMLQLPLPDHLKPYQQSLLDLIPYYKDMDGIGVGSFGRLFTGQDCISPATANGVIAVLNNCFSGVLDGLNIVLVGRSNLCNKPLVQLLQQRNCTVTLCHSRTKDLKKHTQQADVVIAAIGKAKYFDASYFKDDAVVIDIGVNRDENNKLCGDVSIESLKDTNIRVTPTPGGSGALTTAQLMLNVIKCNKLQSKSWGYTSCSVIC